MIDQPTGFDTLKGELQQLHALGLLPTLATPSAGWPAGQRAADTLVVHFESPRLIVFLSLAALVWIAVSLAWF